jgi:hypothetical protein
LTRSPGADEQLIVAGARRGTLPASTLCHKGQRAMAVAKIYPEPQKGGRGKRNSSVTKEFSGARISMARSVLEFAPDLADSIMSGARSLDDAYKTAQQRKRAHPKKVPAGYFFEQWSRGEVRRYVFRERWRRNRLLRFPCRRCP